MIMSTEILDIYDPLENAPTLTIYLLKDGEDWIRISSDNPVVGTQLTRLLQMSQDYRLKRTVSVGDRLTYHKKKEGSPWQSYEIKPSEWVVTKVASYEPCDIEELPEFQGVTIAYCERDPLSLEEVAAKTRETITKVSIASFGGDEAAYQDFLNSEEANKYIK
jgi:hypothetical protein